VAHVGPADGARYGGASAVESHHTSLFSPFRTDRGTDDAGSVLGEGRGVKSGPREFDRGNRWDVKTLAAGGRGRVARDQSAMTKFLLCRHGAHVLGPDVIAGVSERAVLSELGKSQAGALGARLAGAGVDAIYSSPVARVKESAALASAQLEVPVQTSEALTEVRFGEWEGLTLEELRPRALWKQWNAFRSGTRPPGGETLLEVQSRIVAEMEWLRALHPEQTVALFSHGDVIKAAVAYLLGVPLDLFQRIEISLSSVSVVAIGEFGPWVLCVNSTGEIPKG
jgi:broad specificity phosphatase PhoE